MINIEKLENLPKKIGFRKNKISHSNYFHYRRNSEIHKIKNYYPYTIVQRILKHYIGKSFNQAFIHYCKLVPKYQQKVFLEEFEDKRYKNWYLDSNGFIQNDNLKPKYRGPYTIYSEDYQSEIRHKITGHPKHMFRQVFNNTTYTYDYQWFGHGDPWWKKSFYYTATKSDFEIIITQGYKIECVSKNDPRYQKYCSEKAKVKKIQNKLHKKAQKTKQYSFLTKKEQEIRDSKVKDIITRDRFGFNEESFKGLEYHGGKRKRIKNT